MTFHLSLMQICFSSERLDANFIEQSEFTSNLAHELRTPLTILRLNLEMLDEDPNANLENYQAFAKQAGYSLIHLEHLVQDLLLLSRGEKELAYEPIHLQVIFEEIFAELSPEAEQNGVQLLIRGVREQPVQGDPVLIQLAITNLIQNGIRYNHPGGIVEVLLEPDQNDCIFRVRDNGQGVAAEDQIHIFDRFYRGRNAQIARPDGTGLGLAISAHIIRLHGGKIEIASKVGEGSTFSVYFPISEPS